jgi:hypothetical protein
LVGQELLQKEDKNLPQLRRVTVRTVLDYSLLDGVLEVLTGMSMKESCKELGDVFLNRQRRALILKCINKDWEDIREILFISQHQEIVTQEVFQIIQMKSPVLHYDRLDAFYHWLLDFRSKS